MDRSSLNRAIGLCLSAIRRASGKARDLYRNVMRNLNRARRYLNAGRVESAARFAMVAQSWLILARAA